ncbi:PEP/pyruvate-binding domain-containing protein [Actinomadura atramentaria]|uniref:PEP/pyruvate-binding domain-containing protein n=1 Tax=Actinomadura atramentaria TaxID=1990 RepID=UPI00036973B0|nr:PEP/pyruvate-binding domain-containing protein [Actinomadura atramentaria]
MAETWERDWERELVLPLADPDATDAARVGAKGASLARMAEAGLRVPAGFHVTAKAYRRFVEESGIGDQILAAVAECGPDEAEARIFELFAAHEPGTELRGAVRWAYADLGDREHAVAVRASATADDLEGLAFSGRHVTQLGLRGDQALLEAVRRVWASLWTARAINYRERAGLRHDQAAMAVVVQSMLEPESSGSLFSVAPMTEIPDQTMITAVRGSGGAKAEGLVLDRGTARLEGRRSPGKQVLTSSQASELARLGLRVEEIFGRPVAVAWARYEGVPWLLQARPIAGLGDTEVWNDSIASDDAWSNAVFGEVVPDVMTPSTWSLGRIILKAAMPIASVPGYRAYGVIGGRLYQDLSVTAAIQHAFGRAAPPGGTFARLPADMSIEPAALPRRKLLRTLGPLAARMAARSRANRRRLPRFLDEARERSEELRRRTRAAGTPDELIRLWHDDVLPHVLTCSYMLEAAGGERAGSLAATHRAIAPVVGDADADLLLTGVTSPDGAPAATLGPVVGLARYARGVIGRDTYARRWGHRGPHEFELMAARPAEDPDWPGSVTDSARAASSLLDQRAAARREAWRRLRERHPGQAPRVSRRIGRFARAQFQREAARSELVRAIWNVRTWLLRAGELSGHGDDLFFLPLDETLAVLAGDRRPLDRVETRRRTYDRYRALPPYPTVIKGRFDPFLWAADPDRRTDVYDGLRAAPPDETGGTIAGFAGSAGIAEGRVRVLSDQEQGDQLRDGEIIVATATNVGWSPLFARAAAVVTDIGAPHAHMVIAARELGIPAVVGTGDATMRLRTGDVVRVDGTNGRVEFLAPGDARRREEEPVASG